MRVVRIKVGFDEVRLGTPTHGMGVCGYCVLIPKEGKVREGNMQFWALELHIGHLTRPLV